MIDNTFILGAGMTGLAAGFASGFPIYESNEFPGGICSSYFIKPGEKRRLLAPPSDDEAYRFEIGGGHWIFGADEEISEFIRSFSPVKKYCRKASIFLQEKNLSIPYPVQNHLGFLGHELSHKIFSEISENNRNDEKTLKTWLMKYFGQTLCDLFFFPFHELYTAGLFSNIAPQDNYKSPMNISSVKRGLSLESDGAGYNTSFIYPEDGLGNLSRCVAKKCEVNYGKKAVSIDLDSKTIKFNDNSSLEYDNIISTLPLNKMLRLTGLLNDLKMDPHTSVHVLNMGSIRGEKCPDDHWVYYNNTKSGFHRAGFYSNVDSSFLPVSSRQTNDRVCMYIEKAFPGGKKPDDKEIYEYTESVIKEFSEWGFIKDIEVVDSTWIDVAYTWSWPGSKWKEKALKILKKNNIYSIGRFGRWTFQGIADSIKEGLNIGSIFKNF
ncbi:FAD-dependent oxidoreductase [Thermodesulfobacteriota bacterium]